MSSQTTDQDQEADASALFVSCGVMAVVFVVLAFCTFLSTEYGILSGCIGLLTAASLPTVWFLTQQDSKPSPRSWDRLSVVCFWCVCSFVLLMAVTGI